MSNYNPDDYTVIVLDPLMIDLKVFHRKTGWEMRFDLLSFNIRGPLTADMANIMKEAAHSKRMNEIQNMIDAANFGQNKKVD